MIFKEIDINSITERFTELAQQVIDSWDDLQTKNPGRRKQPAVLLDAMQRLGQSLYDQERTSETSDENEINALGDYGLQLMIEMSNCCAELGLEESAHAFENLSLPFALWLGRHGGELRHPEPIINALAYLANRLKEPDDMTELFAMSNEVMESISPGISQDQDNDHPDRPWRLLLINRAIIATRSLNPRFMELAFNTLVEQLPEDAANFFEQGMEQMDIIGYPEQVRTVMQDFYLRHCTNRTLH